MKQVSLNPFTSQKGKIINVRKVRIRFNGLTWNVEYLPQGSLNLFWNWKHHNYFWKEHKARIEAGKIATDKFILITTYNDEVEIE